jgi:hypothetical protein
VNPGGGLRVAGVAGEVRQRRGGGALPQHAPAGLPLSRSLVTFHAGERPRRRGPAGTG